MLRIFRSHAGGRQGVRASDGCPRDRVSEMRSAVSRGGRRVRQREVGLRARGLALSNFEKTQSRASGGCCGLKIAEHDRRRAPPFRRLGGNGNAGAVRIQLNQKFAPLRPD